MEAPNHVLGDVGLDGPARGGRAPRPIGVTGLTISNPYQIDVLVSLAAGEPQRATRTLTATVWYPARHADPTPGPRGAQPAGTHDARPRPARLAGRATWGAEPDRAAGPAPLVILSPAAPGSRAPSWLGEHLAREGYAVLALDHGRRTHDGRGDLVSALRNRPLDVALALRVAADLAGRHPLLHHAWDADRAALVGFAMGAYGALVALGAGLDAPVFERAPFADPLHRELLDDLALDAPFHDDLVDAVTARVRAAVLVAPWGGDGVWTARALARVRTPLLMVGGGGICGAARASAAGIGALRRVFEGTTASERWLLTLEGARHDPSAWRARHAFAGAARGAARHDADPPEDARRIANALRRHLAAFLRAKLRNGSWPGASPDAGETTRDGNRPGFPPPSGAGPRLKRRRAEATDDGPTGADDGLRDLSAAAWAGLTQAWRAHRARGPRPDRV